MDSDNPPVAGRKDHVHIVAVCCNAVLVFVGVVALSFVNEAWAESAFVGGAAIVVPNIWFAWVVRNAEASEQVIARHLVRFVLYAVLLGCGFAWAKVVPEVLLAAAIATHISYVVLVAIFGSRWTVKKIES